MSEKKNNHTLLKVIGGVTVTAASAYAGYSYLVFRNAFDLEKSSIFNKKYLIHTDSNVEEWFSHSDTEDVFINSYDGLNLHALLVHNNDSHDWIVMVHGAGCYSKNLLNQMYEADHRGYNILAIDQRGCGKSKGRYCGLGWNEHYDLISWINYLINRDHDSKIALYGLNIGANTIMNTVGDYIPSNVKCAVEDGGFSEIKDIITHRTRQISKVDPKLFFPAVDVLVNQFLHFSLNDVSTKRQLRNCEIPMLFMHGSDDEIIPTSMVFDNYYACGSEKELNIIEGKSFNNTYTDPTYYETLFEFIDKHVKH